MKRSSCLSAVVLVGLSLTTASMASAAPEPQPAQAGKDSKAAAADGKVVKVAQADPSTAPTQPQPSSEPATTAPTQETPTEPQPAVTLGGTLAPTQDKAAESAEGAGGKKKPRPWANSAIFGLTSMSTSTVFQGQQQYSNPTVDSAIYIQPRYTLNESFQLRARLAFFYEFTNSDSTVTRNEPRFSDTSVQLFYRKIPAVAGFKPQVFVSAAAPTSPESRARTMIVAPGAGFNVARAFPNLLPGGGELDVVGLMSYSHPFYSSRNPEVRGDRPYPLQCAGAGGCDNLLSGVLNPSDTLTYAVNVSATWGKFTPAVYYLGGTQWIYRPTDANVQIAPGQEVQVTSANGSRSSVRQTHYFSAWLDYELNSWLTPEVGYWMARSALNENGRYGNPFFDRYQDMRVYIGANVNIDALVEKITTGSEAEAGIIRSKNEPKKHTPIMAF